jgi:hypothetical protein
LIYLILIILLVGPRAGWVKRFLPNTANRVVFTVLISALIVTWLGMGIAALLQGAQSDGYIDLVFSLLTAGAFYRFISEWWLKGAQRNAIEKT